MQCDIEKILREVVGLNPNSMELKRLSEETFLTVGQNTISGSSIQITQHTQISEGKLENFPIYCKLASQHRSKTNIGIIEWVQVGQHEDAFFLKIITDNPTADDFIHALITLRIMLLTNTWGV